jgi:hypothetical protein
MEPIERLALRLADARRLLEIHTEATGDRAGRRRGYDVLNRSAVMLAVAAWEGFCEEVLSTSGVKISRKLKGKDDLPESVKTPLLYWFFEAHQIVKFNQDAQRAIWSMASGGWRIQYRKYITEKVDALNTPSHANIKKLMNQLLGLANFSEIWARGRYGQEYYIKRLSDALNLRHEIAHGTRGDANVGKKVARDTIALINQLGAWTVVAVNAHEATLDLSRAVRAGQE